MRFRGVETQVIVHTYLGLAIALLVLAAVVWPAQEVLGRDAPPAPRRPILRAFNLLTRPRFAFGTLCIFLYVGGEVAIGVADRELPDAEFCVWRGGRGRPASTCRFYWGGAMVGRFIGGLRAALVSRPARWLACVAAARHRIADFFRALASGARFGVGPIVDRACSIPSCSRLFLRWQARAWEHARPKVSGVICMAIVGGAIVPLVTGTAADLWGPEAVARRAGRLLFRHSRLRSLRASARS